jgi:hypothetical protein
MEIGNSWSGHDQIGALVEQEWTDRYRYKKVDKKK